MTALYVVWVTFALRPGSQEAFIELVSDNARRSLAEPGCRRFDVLLPVAADAPLALYEIYDDAAAFDAHLATRHYREFAAAAAPLVVHKAVQAYALKQPSAAPTKGQS
jgi:(4S)-4-hydroxy-5-phosphonooxypentane-2,3-dione isomerase